MLIVLLYSTEKNTGNSTENRAASHRMDRDLSVRLQGWAHDAQPQRDNPPPCLRRRGQSRWCHTDDLAEIMIASCYCFCQLNWILYSWSLAKFLMAFVWIYKYIGLQHDLCLEPNANALAYYWICMYVVWLVFPFCTSCDINSTAYSSQMLFLATDMNGYYNADVGNDSVVFD